jgi:hypothetical protein
MLGTGCAAVVEPLLRTMGRVWTVQRSKLGGLGDGSLLWCSVRIWGPGWREARVLGIEARRLEVEGSNRVQ